MSNANTRINRVSLNAVRNKLSSAGRVSGRAPWAVGTFRQVDQSVPIVEAAVSRLKANDYLDIEIMNCASGTGIYHLGTEIQGPAHHGGQRERSLSPAHTIV
jgi:hypothetical protein